MKLFSVIPLSRFIRPRYIDLFLLLLFLFACFSIFSRAKQSFKYLCLLRTDGDFRDFRAVASDVGICSDIGANVLRDGGNAVDSAVAVALCLGVVNGESSGIGLEFAAR